MSKLKLGQIITIDKDHDIESIITNTKIQVKAGDKAVVTKQGIKYLTGQAKGMVNLSDIDTGGIDFDSIAKLVYRRLSLNHDLDTFIDDYDIDKDYLLDDIADVLMDIL